MVMTVLLGWTVGAPTRRAGCGVRSPRLAGFGCVFVSGRHSCYRGRGTGCHLDSQYRVPRDVLLARATTRPLTRHHSAALEDLATPHAPRLCALDRAREALDANRAVRAE